METLTFAGIEGTIKHVSEHGNYVTLQFSDRVTIIGTFSNDYHWDEVDEPHSGFLAFITYIGTDGSDTRSLFDFIAKNGGYFRKGEENPRPSKWTDFPKEIKVRGLQPQAVIDLIHRFDTQQWQAA